MFLIRSEKTFILSTNKIPASRLFFFFFFFFQLLFPRLDNIDELSTLISVSIEVSPTTRESNDHRHYSITKLSQKLPNSFRPSGRIWVNSIDYYYQNFTFLKVFHASVSWWPFTGVWVTACLLKSSRLFYVFWLIFIMLYFGWSPLVLLFPSPSVFLLNSWYTVPSAPITISITVTFMFRSFSVR